MVRLELKSGVATPTFGVKIATLSGGTALATKNTFAVEFPTMRMSNLANAPAVIVFEDGWIWKVNEFVLLAETVFPLWGVWVEVWVEVALTLVDVEPLVPVVKVAVVEEYCTTLNLVTSKTPEYEPPLRFAWTLPLPPKSVSRDPNSSVVEGEGETKSDV